MKESGGENVETGGGGDVDGPSSLCRGTMGELRVPDDEGGGMGVDCSSRAVIHTV